MKAPQPAARAESCRHCGGTLRPTASADLFRCEYCDTDHLQDPGEARAYVPAQRLGRRRIAARLSEQLRTLGTDGHGLERLERVWLPFWQIAGTLAGWQRYLTVEQPAGDTERRAMAVDRESEVEEVVTRRVNASLAACDLRGWGLIGIADVVERVPLRPMRARIFERETVLSVGVSRRAADRRLLLGKQQVLRPRGVRDLRQHFQILRPERSLVYYPVWRAVFTVHGVPCDGILDGLDGRLLRARLPVPDTKRDPRWWAVAAATAWAGSIHVAFAAVAGALWIVRRLGAHGAGDGAWTRWLSAELSGMTERAHVVHGGQES